MASDKTDTSPDHIEEDCGTLDEHWPEMATRVRALAAERDELQEILDLQRKRELAHIKLWQERTGKPSNVQPDYGELLGWLVEELAKAERELEGLGKGRH